MKISEGSSKIFIISLGDLEGNPLGSLTVILIDFQGSDVIFVSFLQRSLRSLQRSLRILMEDLALDPNRF